MGGKIATNAVYAHWKEMFLCCGMLALGCFILCVLLLLSFLPWGLLLWTDYLDFHAFIRRP